MTRNSSPPPSEKPLYKAPDPPSAAGRAAAALYNLAWYPVLPLALMLGGARGAAARRQRMGRVDAISERGAAPRVWLHASSVGEIEAVRPLAMGLTEGERPAAMVVTTMTESGRQAAAHRIPRASACLIAPLDHPRAVRSFLNAVAPGLVLIAEAELWPNYFIESRRLGARVAIVNGRLSARSLARYRLMGPLWRRALNCADLLLVQSAADAARYAALGAPQARIMVTGNTKFAPLAPADSQAHPALARFAAGAPTLIAGSTAPREEEAVLDAWMLLRRQFDSLRLVLAPRHLERVPEVVALLERNRVDYVRASALKAGAEPSSAADVLLLDTLGDLRLLYRWGTLAFVGGSLFQGRGGQNPGEAAAAGMAVLFGPFHQNQLEIAQALIARGGAMVVSSARELACAAARLLGDDRARRQAASSAREVYQSLSGGSARTLAELRALIDSR